MKRIKNNDGGERSKNLLYSSAGMISFLFLMLIVLAGSGSPAMTEKMQQLSNEKLDSPIVKIDTLLVGGEVDELNRVDCLYIIEESAEPEGGYEAFYKHIGENLKYPDKKGVVGKVFVQFVVETDGSLQEMKVVRGIEPNYDSEAMRVVASFGKWKPSENRGHKVRQRMIVPISFK